MTYIYITLKNNFVYKWSVIFSTLSSVMSVAVLILLWKYLYRNNEDMVNYMVKYTILSNIFSFLYCKGMASRIGDKVADGNFVFDLIKPMNIFIVSWQREIAELINNFLTRGIPVILVYSYFLIYKGDYYNILSCAISLLMSHILFVLMYSLLGFMAFVLINIWPFQRVLDDTIRILGGGIIPLSLLSGSLYQFASILPFRFLYSFPLEIVLGNIKQTEIINGFLIELIWIVILAILNYVIYLKALNKVVVQGG